MSNAKKVRDFNAWASVNVNSSMAGGGTIPYYKATFHYPGFSGEADLYQCNRNAIVAEVWIGGRVQYWHIEAKVSSKAGFRRVLTNFFREHIEPQVVQP